MKKLSLKCMAIVALCCFCLGANAQEKEIKHEIALSYGVGPVTTWAKIGRAIGDALFSKLKVDYENTSWFGPISAEYFYHVDAPIGIGGIVSFSRDNDDLLVDKQKQGDRKTNFITFMPAMKWEYLRRKHFAMYLKAAAGVTLEVVNEKYKDEKGTNTSAMFNGQLSPLGIEAGGEHVRGFLEVGFGEQGIALAGIRCKF